MNVVSPRWNIEQRAEAMADSVAKAAKGHKNGVHLLAHSFAGVDARAALSLHGLNSRVRSLTTLCTPHHGMTLVDKSLMFPDQFGDMSQSDRAFDILGMSTRNVAEFTTKNMSAFKQVVKNAPDVDYYSFGSKKKEL